MEALSSSSFTVSWRQLASKLHRVLLFWLPMGVKPTPNRYNTLTDIVQPVQELQGSVKHNVSHIDFGDTRTSHLLVVVCLVQNWGSLTRKVCM